MFHIASQLSRRRNEEVQFGAGIGRGARDGTRIWTGNRRSKASNSAAGNRRSQGAGSKRSPADAATRGSVLAGLRLTARPQSGPGERRDKYHRLRRGGLQQVSPEQQRNGRP